VDQGMYDGEEMTKPEYKTSGSTSTSISHIFDEITNPLRACTMKGA
jgi:hypothetical protein